MKHQQAKGNRTLGMKQNKQEQAERFLRAQNPTCAENTFERASSNPQAVVTMLFFQLPPWAETLPALLACYLGRVWMP